MKDLGETDKFKVMLSKSGYAPPRNGNAPYLVAVVVSLLIAVAGSAFIIFIRPDYDPIIITLTVTGVATALTTQILQLMKLNDVEKKTDVAVVQLDENHKTINSQLSAAIETARRAGYGAGLEAGQDKANQRTDELKRKAAADPPAPEVASIPAGAQKITGTIEGVIEETKGANRRDP